MRLTILGTGSARPVGDSAQSGILVESGDTAVLFDIGSGIAKQLEAHVGATNCLQYFAFALSAWAMNPLMRPPAMSAFALTWLCGPP